MAAANANTVPLTAYASPELRDVVDLLAEKKKRSRSELLLIAITDLIQREAEQERMTREAMAEVDAGHVIDHQSVQAWADSLSSDNPLPVPR